MANRIGGATTGDDYRKSWTLLFHGPDQEWQGHVCFGDNHVEFSKSFFPPNVSHECGLDSIVQDNIFNAEFNVMGCFSTEHKDFNSMSCIDYCGAFVAQGEPDPIER